MSYQKTNWKNTPSTETPINAENLNKMEDGIYEAHQSFDNIPEWAKQPEKPTYTAEEVGSLDESEILKLAITPTATGTQIVARDSAEWPLQALTVYGRTEQAKTSGAQLIDFSRAVYQQCTLVDADTGTIKSNISNYYFCTIYLDYLADYFMANLGKTISFRADNNPNYISIVIYGERTSGGTTQENSNQGSRVSIIIAEDFTSIRQVELRVNRKPSNAFTDTTSLISGLMLYEGSEEKAYEPYTGGKPSPSLDYPQSIVSAGCVLTTGSQLLDGDDLEIGGINGGTGELVDELNGIRIVDIGVTPGTLYTLSGYAVDYNLQSSHVFNADGSRIGAFTNSAAMLDNAAKLSLCFARKDGTNMADTDLVYLRNHLMLNEGSTALPYEPYTGGVPAAYLVGIEVALTGKNLLDVSKIETRSTSSGDGLIANNDGVLTVTAPASGSSAIDTRLTLKELCPNIAPGNTYTLSATSTGNDKNIYLDKAKSVWVYGKSRILTENDLNSVVYLYASGIGTTATISKLQLELNSTATAYEPYRGRQTITLASNGLPGIPVSSGGNYTDADGQRWVCDTIEYRGGQAVYVKRVWSKTFTGGAGEYWSTYNSTNYEGFASYCLPENYRLAPGFCNLLTVHAGALLQGEDGLWIGLDNKLVYNHNSRFYDTTLEDKGLANWKAYLAAHPMTIMTYLTTPIETPLTAAEAAQLAALHTYKPTTTITNDAGAGMDVTYVADTKAYIDNKFAELQAAQATTNAQLI